MKTRVRFAMLVGALAFAFALGTAPAHAGQLRFDLGGTWTGSIKCKGSFDGAKDPFSIAPTMRISQSGLEMGLVLDFGGNDIEHYTGLANPDAKKPDKKGEVAIVFCGTNDQVGDVVGDGQFDELGRMVVSSKPGQVKASFKGTTIYSDFSVPGPLPAGGYTCKWKYTRVSNDPPNLQTTCDAPIATLPPFAP